jgi:hypothetical protein
MKPLSVAVIALFAFSALIVTSAPAFAHHGAAAYNTSEMTTLTGKVTNFQYVNPHVIISIETKNPTTGKAEVWQGELTESPLARGLDQEHPEARRSNHHRRRHRENG